ncbi:hypothetical protein ACHWQZ_G004551 [Mnemiopsis leidyi]
MAVFGNVYGYKDGTASLLYTGTIGDTFANYFFAFIFILLFLLSTACNPVIFVHYRRQKQNISSILFQILSMNDFCTCLVSVPYILYLLLGYDLEEEKKETELQPWQIWYTVIRICLFNWSILVGAVLGVVRSLVIWKPFFKIRNVCVLPILGAAASVMAGTVVLHVTYDQDALHWSIYSQQVLDFAHPTTTTILIILLYVISVFVSLTSAAVSMRGLHLHHIEREKAGLPPGGECPACLTVVIINCLVMGQFLVAILSLTVMWACPDETVPIHYLEFIQFPLANCILSALNPVIMLVRSGRFGSAAGKDKKGKSGKQIQLTEEKNISSL